MVRDINGIKFPIVVVANKIDKESSRGIGNDTYKVYTKNFNENVFLIETTTKTNKGCDYALECILSQIQPKKVLTMTQTSW